MRDKDAAFHPSSQALSLYCSFPFSLMRMGGVRGAGGGGGGLQARVFQIK